MEKFLDNQILTDYNVDTSFPIISMSSTYNSRNTTALTLTLLYTQGSSRFCDLHAKLFTFLLVYLFSLVYFYLYLFHFLVIGMIYVKDCSRNFISISLLVCSLYKDMFIT